MPVLPKEKTLSEDNRRQKGYDPICLDWLSPKIVGDELSPIASPLKRNMKLKEDSPKNQMTHNTACVGDDNLEEESQACKIILNADTPSRHPYFGSLLLKRNASIACGEEKKTKISQELSPLQAKTESRRMTSSYANFESLSQPSLSKVNEIDWNMDLPVTARRAIVAAFGWKRPLYPRRLVLGVELEWPPIL